ncbi:MAG: purine-nucleoside phosphorylase [Ktedonobacterales bacterium]|nr:purine-nucleoside phosphorylase [Ktedonobacterales bacterium]
MANDSASPPPSQLAKAAADWIAAECQRQTGQALAPQVGIILGSGLNGVLDDAEVLVRLAYADIPHFAAPTVSGHAGQFELARLGGVPIAILRGRFHLYEGHDLAQVVLPVRVVHALGATVLIVTNAAGGLNPNFRQGELMLLSDHIGLPSLAGQNPLIGPNDAALGERFVPMGHAYDQSLRNLAQFTALKVQVALREGVYVMVSGPTYETPAELRMLRQLGADAVGMSTVPEVIAANHLGMQVLGISCITNVATPEAAAAVNHAEVLSGAELATPGLNAILHGVVQALR